MPFMGTRKNFYTETLQEIAKWGYREKQDIRFIGTKDYTKSCTLGEFALMANREYDSGFGEHMIREDLIIVFEDGGRLMRQEYDGSEWWEYIPPFVPCAQPEKLTKVFYD